MEQSAIFGPFFATMLLTLVVWVYMYFRRLHFINGNDFGPEDFDPARFAELSPSGVSNPSDNLKNLFEMPVLFYALALYLFVTQEVDATYVGAAWCFVAFRVLHSAVHCTLNAVPLRFSLYLLSSLAVWFIAARAAIQYLSA